MVLCECCGRVNDHVCRQEQLSDFFVRRHAEAKQELDHLRRVFKDVCWYNFEVHCRDWRRPWPESVFGTQMTLHGYRVVPHWVNGRRHESGTYPIYFTGEVHEAPRLPPQILIQELVLAQQLVQVYADAITAPYDWAPGGSEYEKLLQTTMVPTSSNTENAKHATGGRRRRGFRRRGRE